jgi:di/tricarboxylate transporter
MVMSPGGYRFSHYMRVGAPLLVIVIAVSLFLIPIIWPF